MRMIINSPFVRRSLGLLLLAGLLAVQAQGQVPPALAVEDPAIEAAFTEAVATRTTRSGETMQRLGDAAYGTSLAWPLVWWSNRVAIPDPERFSKGMTVRIPRLRADFSDPICATALDAAYRQVYARYRALPERTRAQRQWVLLQAADAGIDPLGDSWEGALSPDDTAWARGRLKVAGQLPGLAAGAVDESAGKPPVDLPLATASGEMIRSFGKAPARAAYLEEIVAGAPLPVEEMAAWVAALGSSPDEARVIAELEAVAAREDAPPQVHLVLAIHYQRKGLLTKEYAALVRSEESAARRPDLVFNVVLLGGRKKLIEGAVPASDLMVGEVRIRTVPEGVRVYLDGVDMGQSPLDLSKVAAGARTLRLSKDKYLDREVQLDVAIASRLRVDQELEARTGTLIVRTRATGELTVGERPISAGEEVDLPFGRHRIALRDKNYEPVDLEVTIEPDQVVDHEIPVKRVEALWTLNGPAPGARVWVDGRDMGTMPVAPVRLLTGYHKVVVEQDGYRPYNNMMDFDLNGLGTSQAEDGTWKGMAGVYPVALIPVVPHGSPKMDGRAEDWDALTRFGNGTRTGSDNNSGGNIEDWKSAQDSQYLYWYIRLNPPSILQEQRAYSIRFTPLSLDGKHRYRIMFSPEGKGVFRVIFERTIDGENSWTKLADVTSGDYAFGEDFMEVRLSKALLLKQLGMDREFSIGINNYLVLDGSDGSVVGIHSARLEPEALDTWYLRTNFLDMAYLETLRGLLTLAEGVAPTLGDDRFGNTDWALALDGQPLSYQGLALESPSQPFTLKYWFRSKEIPTTARGAQATLLRFGADKTVWSFGLSEGKPSVSLPTADGKGLTLTGSARVADSLWHQVVVVHDGKTLKLWLDGKKTGEKGIGSPLAMPKDTVVFGESFTGSLEGLSWKPGTLTDKEVETLYAEEKP